MTCTICGKATLSGAMLCGPCRAALKRARYVSVQVIPPRTLHRHRSRPATTTTTTKDPLPLGLEAPAPIPRVMSAVAEPPPPSGRSPILRSLALGAAAVVALGVVAYFGQARDQNSGTSPGQAVAPVTLPAALPALEATQFRPASTDAGAGMAQPPLSATAVPAEAAPPDGGKARNADARATTPRGAPAAPARSATTAAATGNVDLNAFGATAEPLRQAPVVQPPVAAAAPPPDRWQVMESELARCEREGGFGGFLCGQRVRIQSCEGLWGTVPQCAVPPENPRGQ